MSEKDSAELIKAGLRAVIAGAQIAESACTSPVVAHKGSLRDIVTQVDLDVSTTIIKHLSSKGWVVISEEMPTLSRLPSECWVIDPIDGTVNYANGLPQYAISAGWVNNGSYLLGAVCAPALNELFFTLNTKRALLNGKPFAHEHQRCDTAVVAASFSCKADAGEYTLFQHINDSTRGCLRTGSAALNVCWAASNRLQAAYGFGAKVWDIAGALAIAHAAGCEVKVVRHDHGLILDYCVGSREVVDHIIRLASAQRLWRE